MSSANKLSPNLIVPLVLLLVAAAASVAWLLKPSDSVEPRIGDGHPPASQNGRTGDAQPTSNQPPVRVAERDDVLDPVAVVVGDGFALEELIRELLAAVRAGDAHLAIGIASKVAESGRLGADVALELWQQVDSRIEPIPGSRWGLMASSILAALGGVSEEEVLSACVDPLREPWTLKGLGQESFDELVDYISKDAQPSPWHRIPVADRTAHLLLRAWLILRTGSGVFPAPLVALIEEFAVGDHPEEVPDVWLSMAFRNLDRAELRDRARPVADRIISSDRFSMRLKRQLRFMYREIPQDLYRLLELAAESGRDRGNSSMVAAHVSDYFAKAGVYPDEVAMIAIGLEEAVGQHTTQSVLAGVFGGHNRFTYEESRFNYSGVLRRWLATEPFSADGITLMAVLSGLSIQGIGSTSMQQYYDGQRGPLVSYLTPDELVDLEARLLTAPGAPTELWSRNMLPAYSLGIASVVKVSVPWICDQIKAHCREDRSWSHGSMYLALESVRNTYSSHELRQHKAEILELVAHLSRGSVVSIATRRAGVREAPPPEDSVYGSVYFELRGFALEAILLIKGAGSTLSDLTAYEQNLTAYVDWMDEVRTSGRFPDGLFNSNREARLKEAVAWLKGE